jgi:hypothetical protein
MNNPDLVKVSTSDLISVKQGDSFRKLILQKKPLSKIRQISTAKRKINNLGIEFTILSPNLHILNKLNEKWESLRNEHSMGKKNISSIKESYIQSLKVLSISNSLRGLGFNEEKPLIVDYVKVSHHGSLNNTSQELLSLVSCNNYLISTNGGAAYHKHPSRETIARIVYNSNRSEKEVNIYFNYDIIDLKKRIGDFINDKDFQYGNWRTESKNKFYKL